MCSVFASGIPSPGAMGFLHRKFSVMECAQKGPFALDEYRMFSMTDLVCLLKYKLFRLGSVYSPERAELEGLCCHSYLISDQTVGKLLL